MSDCGIHKKNNPPNHYDLIVIGAGSGGFSAAITAAEQDKTVLLVGYGTIGGTCVNIGCIPSKNLIRAVASLQSARNASRFAGIEAQAKMINWQALIAQKQQLVDTLRHTKYSDILAEYPHITYVTGKAKLNKSGDKTGVVVNAKLYQTNKILIATGSSNAIPAISGLAGIDYLDSTRLLAIKQLPQSLLVIGAGVIGCELAQAFSRAGVKVTICCRSRLLPHEEPEISETLTHAFQQEGISLYQGITYQAITQNSDDYQLSFKNSEGLDTLVCTQQVLVSTGRKPNISGLNCEAVGIHLNDKGGITVDEYLATSQPSIYAVGDVTGQDMFVYMAAYGAKLATNNALNGNKKRYDASAMPVVTFTDPQVARVGLSEQQAREAGFDVKTSTLPLSQIPRAIVALNTHGVIKLVADKQTDRLLGAHICAVEAGDSIQTAVLAIKNNMTTSDLANTIFPYLTMVEGLKLAAQIFDKDIGKLSCCAG